MRTRILELEKIAKELEPSSELRTQWNSGIQNYADNFLNELPDVPCYIKTDNPGAGLPELEMDQKGQELGAVLDLLKREVDTPSLNPASGGHFGYIPGGGIFPTAMGDYLAAITNRYSGVYFANPGAVRIENQLIRWMCKLMGYPATALGNLTSGGSIANLIAIVTARDFHKIASKEVERAVIYLTAQVHHCVHKAIRIAGLGEAQVRTIPMDARFRMDAIILKSKIEEDKKNGLNPFLVIASAGTTDTGSVDPLNEIADLAEANNMWYHIDAAYGGFFIMADVENEDGSSLKDSFKGIERSDSLAIDPHKGMFLSYGLGAVLVKNVKALHESHYYQAHYMQDAFSPSDEPSPADLSPELTKHFRGLRMWMPLQLFGVQPFKACLEEKIHLTRYFYQKVQSLGFEVGPYPELSVAIYRYVPKNGAANEFNQKLIEGIHRDGRIFVSSTTIDGVFWIRIALLCFRSHLREVDLFLEILKKEIDILEERGENRE